MTEKNSPMDQMFDEIQELFVAAGNDDLSHGQAERLECLVCEDATARRLYAKYVLETASLRVWAASETDECEEQVLGHEQDDLDLSVQSVPPTLVVPTVSRTMPGVSVNNWLISYFAASVILCVALLGAWAYKITHHDNHIVSHENQPGIEKRQSEFVGRITCMAGCEWSDPDARPYAGSYVPLGRKYELTSGLLEITYATGVRVIIEGPCSYTVDSGAGGRLQLGKLVARVEKRGERREGRGKAISKSQIINPQPPAPSPQPPVPLFAIHTPTAVVTDLGTEFGVEVAENGDTTSHVFRGSVKVQSLGGDNSQDIVLRENESASVQSGADGKAVVVRQESFVPGTFVCRMPQWTPFEVFSTGLGLKEGETDPHWQIVARSDQPEFKPHSAVVTSISMEFSDIFRPNDASQSQWISTGGEMPTLTEGITFSFRTTFKLSDLPASTAKSVSLRGGFMADNHVTAIRLNGKEVSVPEHGYQAPFNYLFRFAVRDGFVEGTNVLEFDVLNEAPGERMLPVSPMALRVELDGRILRGERTAAVDSSKTKKTKAGKEERK